MSEEKIICPIMSAGLPDGYVQCQTVKCAWFRIGISKCVIHSIADSLLRE